ncbi:T9SS type A sorting domain-containing protein [Prolixibacter sp. NT017]|uniref:T9SS type A sorting domain-containing protein n=1 Tax=Prolixibacter sp. NT017 TaxID=2652390 RepID=UPI00127BBE8A|nr:T9SS type A sorting domain-containing protein [Prolixibacter sp. NT017]GET26963.1 pectate lyase [Prolixibacter sp. NT017]
MKKRIPSIFIFSLISLLTISAFAQGNDLPAFPGAEGYGKYTTGGRGGQVIYVTSLSDDYAPGTLRYALYQSGPRIIEFKVSGTIQLKSDLKITQPNVTIAGQTAPGDGICLRDYPVIVEADNVIIRFMRFRMGDAAKQQNDALGGRNHKNIIIDHCSASWSTDECVSFYDNQNFTLQWCIISESLRNSIHEKGSHGYGGIWGGEKATFHHNLLADHDSRNPRFCGSRYTNQPDEELVDYRNNVIYNWGHNSAYAGEGGSYNMVNNYYKSGPATSSSVRFRILQPYADDGSNQQPSGTYGHFYIAGNYVENSSNVTNNNWTGVSLHSSFTTYAPNVTLSDVRAANEFSVEPVKTTTAQEAYQDVLNYAGASLVRDTVDKRIVHDTQTGTPTYNDGGNGSTGGIIDTQTAVGGWPELKSTTAPADSDGDGMPDEWEKANNLDPNNPNDAQQTTVDGQYPNLEVYLNSLVAGIMQNEGSVATAVDGLKKNIDPLKVVYNQRTKQLDIRHTRTIVKVQLYSVTGIQVKTFNTDQQTLSIQLPDLAKGVYIVRVWDDLNRAYSQKILNY